MLAGIDEFPFGDFTEPGKLSQHWLVTCGRQEEPALFHISKKAQSSGSCLEISIPKALKWLRFEQVVPHKLLQGRHLRLRMRYSAESEVAGRGAPIGMVAIYAYDKSYGTHQATFDGALTTSPHLSEVDCMLRFGAPVEAEKEYRLTIRLEKPVRLRLFSVSLESVGEESYYRSVLEAAQKKSLPDTPEGKIQAAPYRIAEFPISSKLAALNDEMDKRLRKDPAQWLHDMLLVALRLEDYPTASRLADHILKRFWPSGPQMNAVLPRIVDSYVAMGNFRALTDLCLDLARTAEGKKFAASIIPLIEKDVVSETGNTAGGLYQVNQQIQRAPHEISLSRISGVLAGQADDHLFLANYFRTRDPGRYAAALDSYFASFDLPQLPRLDLSVDNVLSNAEFEDRRCASPAEPTPGMNTNPLVSVIIAAHNCETSLKYAVNSILRQSYENIEVLVADDCSTDATAETMKEFAGDERVRLFQSEANQGPYNIRNALIGKSKGTYITFHDSDDLALPHRVEMQLRDLRRNGALVSVGRWLRVTPEGHFIAFRDGKFLRMCINSIMFYRGVFDAWGPYRSVLFGADSEFFERARGFLGPDRVRHLEVPCVLGLWSDSSLTRTPGIEADESGYRSEKRRRYAAIAGRQRILGEMIIPNEHVAQVLDGHGIVRKPRELKILPTKIATEVA